MSTLGIPSGLGPFDLIAVFSAVFGEIGTIRETQALPVATLHVGKEWLQAEESPPRIVIVPKRMQYASGRGMGNQTGIVGDFNPKALYRRMVVCEAHIWGDQPYAVSEQDTWQSFNTAVELERELLVALSHNLGGPAAVVSANMS